MRNIRLIQAVIVSVAVTLVVTVLYNEYNSDSASVTSPAFASLPEVATTYKTDPQTSPVNLEASYNRSIAIKSPSFHDPTSFEMKGSIQPGDTFDSSLRRLSLTSNVRQLIITSLSSHLDFRRLDTKDRYTVVLNGDGELLNCTFEAGPLEIYVLEVKDGAVKVEKNEIQLETKTIRIAGEITSSLFASFSLLDELPSLVYVFADIFSSKIDFNTESQKGDTFNLIVDKYYKDGNFIGYGKIQAAQYSMTKGKVVDGFYFSTKDKSGSYFDNEGKEVGTSFLRSPVPMGRVTSRFTYRRKHPITGRVQPHLGVDLAAPVGTPILAASDGKVISIGRNGGNGRQIILSHNGGIKTYYGHLSRYKKGLRKGSFVEKKDTIGYVGSSGLSTGPHLDYRIKKNGSFKNPFSVEFAPQSELSGEELTRFKKEAASLKNVLSSNTKSPVNIVQVKNFTLAPDQKLNFL